MDAEFKRENFETLESFNRHVAGILNTPDLWFDSDAARALYVKKADEFAASWAADDEPVHPGGDANSDAELDRELEKLETR